MNNMHGAMEGNGGAVWGGEEAVTQLDAHTNKKQP
jgi:hypothetical protein